MYNNKSVKSIFGLSSSIKSSLSKLKKIEKYKKKKYVENLITSKGNTTKINKKNEAIKNPFDSKTNKSIFGPKKRT